ncbi:S41 family peptidase [Dyella telluris]|uniref:S41 family peptidase n=1 Tax=Dyella telluris TaxID=2763498 RepID=A0A7G8Q502_9GAMM|nr:S41 family peptidase [Dyella telluris]QNK01860.1 S41 family peptidase [Dyella telluris]
MIALASVAAFGSFHSLPMRAHSPDLILRTISENRVTPPARGYWDLPSYGMAFDVKPSSVDVYDHAGGLCWRDTEYSGMQAATELIPFFTTSASGSLTSFASSPDGTRYQPHRMAGMPIACTGTMDRTNPEYIFDAVSASLTEFYPFAREHHVNWSERATRLRPRILQARTEQDLLAVLSALFQNVEDPHTSISGQINGKPFRLRSFRGDDFRALNQKFSLQRQYNNFLSWVIDSWMPGERRQAAATLLPGTHRQALGSALVWGKLTGNVGYLAINEMTGLGADTDIEGERTRLRPALDLALTDLKDTSALVLDISHNLGGDDEVSADIAARFADKVRPAYSKQAFHGGQVQRFDIVPHDGVCYRKPVYMLTSELTASAAEVFALRMRQLPNVIQVGEPTQGIFSDATEKGLPNGWILSMSTEIYRGPGGQTYEGLGLPPRIHFQVIGLKPSTGDYGDAIRKAGALAAGEYGAGPAGR